MPRPLPVPFAALLVIAIIAAGCTSTAYTPTPPTPTPTPAPTSAPTPTSALTSAPTPAPTSEPSYDPNRTMWRIFSGTGQTFPLTQSAVAEAMAEGDISQAPIIVEVMRFWADATLIQQYRDALLQFTGQDFWEDLHPWNAAMEWLGSRREEFAPPDEYLQWKANLLSLIDPRMAAFLTSVPGSERIDLTEVVWGGVLTDGIPDLQFAPTLTPAEADYLHPRDRVFGVSINGEHRAYPLRIMNPHEMANDVLGGEPFALAY